MASKGTEGDPRDELDALRSVALGAVLVAVFAGTIALICSVIGVLGYALVELGCITFEQLTSAPSVILTMLVAGAILAAIICYAVNYSLARPLRRMTLAMGHLASGDFGYRLESPERFKLREAREFERSFNVAAAELEGTEMMRAGFISDFSHEFRTPINSLSGFAQLLRDDGLTENERREYAGIIVDEAARLAGLSERILLLSKVEAATILPHAEDVDVAEQLRRCALVLETRLEDAGVRLDLSLDDAHVCGNADYLMQVWMNLLDNAIKFSPAGSRVSVALYGGRAREEGRAARTPSLSGCPTRAKAWTPTRGAMCSIDSTRAIRRDRPKGRGWASRSASASSSCTAAPWRRRARRARAPSSRCGFPATSKKAWRGDEREGRRTNGRIRRAS